MKLNLAKPEHEIAYQDLAQFLKEKTGNLSAIEQLAIAANMLGKMIALQDQRKYTSDEIMTMVAANIEHGNQQLIDQLKNETAGRA